MIRVCETGRNPTVRHLGRTRGVSVAWLHECFQMRDIHLQYVDTAQQAADIYTKMFNNPAKWEAVCDLVGVLDPKRLTEIMGKRCEYWTTSTATRGEAAAAPLDPHVVLDLPRGRTDVAPDDVFVMDLYPGRNMLITSATQNGISTRISACNFWPTQARTYVHGKGRCLGCTFEKGVPRVGVLSRPQKELMSFFNDVLRESMGSIGFEWTSLQINVDTVSDSHVDKNNKAATKPTERIWNWVSQVLEGIPRNVTQILLTDANGKIGKIKEWDILEEPVDLQAELRTG
jgi:hypothetical protein